MLHIPTEKREEKPSPMKMLSTICTLLLILTPIMASPSESEVYIVYFGEHKGNKAVHEIEENHHSYLTSVKETEEVARASLLYSYKHSINGFAAMLTPYQASKLSELEEVISVFRSHPRKNKMHTTRSWKFVGLEEGMNSQFHLEAEKSRDLLTKASYGLNVIVGVLDSGFWPESMSYSDDGMGPIPKLWRGICQKGDAFNSSHCNSNGSHAFE